VGKFYLYTDGALGDKDNPGGLGAMLIQKQEDDTERIVTYASRGLKDHKKNYSAFLLDLAAAVYGIDHFDVYLKGRQFVLCTDHK
jgi:ribonuclease HI